MTQPGAADGLLLKTLNRGLDVLQALSAGTPRSVAELSDAVGLHRSITYRLVRTLEEREFIERGPDGRYRLGLAIAALARSVRHDLTAAALPELAELAEATASTAFVVVPSGSEAVTLTAVEPRRSRAHVSQRPGQRHPLDRGAPGLAILAALPPRAGERAEVPRTRELGYVRTTGEVIPGLSALAAPLRFADGSVASLALVFVAGELDETSAVDRLKWHAHRLEALASRS